MIRTEKKSLGGVLLGETEGNGDISLANGVVEDAGAVGTVLVESCERLATAFIYESRGTCLH
jgi:hypothetical protein